MLACIQERKIKLEENLSFWKWNEKVYWIRQDPLSMSIDIWTVDYVLLDENDYVVGDFYGYRDYRKDGMNKVVNKAIDEKEAYAKTDF